MPGVTLHFVLARRVLEDWRATDSTTPFDVDDPDQINAFHHGSIGPDLGYFPGGERILSELSHCVSTGRLARTLIDIAQTPVERAFAWGWLTHVLGDQVIHPLIGRAVGELTRGSRDIFVDGASDPLAHLRIELGLDCWFAARRREARSVRLRPVFGEDSIAFLQRAYALTYGVTVPAADFLASHRATGKRSAQSLSTLWIIGALMGDGRAARAAPPLRRILRAAYQTSTLRGFWSAYVNPVYPSDWLVDEVMETLPRHTRSFMEILEGGTSRIEDRHLDTGRLLSVETEHPGTRRALEGLARLAAAHGNGARTPSGPVGRAGPAEAPARPAEAA